MKECLKFYIDGQWVDPVVAQTFDVINPASEEPMGRISMGSAADVDKGRGGRPNRLRKLLPDHG